jgi:predicted dinucleotide-binding enzyme
LSERTKSDGRSAPRLRRKGMSSSTESPNRKDQTSATRGPFREAVQSADVVIVTMPWPVTEALVCEHAADLDDKIVIDATNPLNPAETGLALGFLTSGVELLQGQARRAKFFKTFNSAGASILVRPNFPQGKTVMFVAGPQGRDKKVVMLRIRDSRCKRTQSRALA